MDLKFLINQIVIINDGIPDINNSKHKISHENTDSKQKHTNFIRKMIDYTHTPTMRYATNQKAQCVQ